MVNVRMLCQVVLSVYGEINEILSHNAVKLIKRGKKGPITQILMNLSPTGEISNPLGVDFEGRLGIKVRAYTWITKYQDKWNKEYVKHYSQNVCDLHGRKLQPLYVNGEYAIFYYQKAALVQACHETKSVRILTLSIDNDRVKAEEVLPWTNTAVQYIRTEADQEQFLRNFILKHYSKSQYLAATLDGMRWVAKVIQGDRKPSFFLTKKEVALMNSR